MIPTWKDILATQQRFDDLRSEREVDRLLRSGRPKRVRRALPGIPVRAWLAQAQAWLVQGLWCWVRRLPAKTRPPSRVTESLTADC